MSKASNTPLKRADDIQYKYEGEEGRMMTMLYLEWDPKTKQLIYSSGGIMLGIVPERQKVINLLKDTSLSVHPGDKIIIYTDGITEALNEQGQQYTLDRLVASLENHGDKPIDQLTAAIKNDVYSFIGKVPQHDDITLVGMEIV